MSSKIEQDLAVMEMRAVRVEQQLEEARAKLDAAERLVRRIGERLEWADPDDLPTCSRQIFKLLQAAGRLIRYEPAHLPREVRRFFCG